MKCTVGPEYSYTMLLVNSCNLIEHLLVTRSLTVLVFQVVLQDLAEMEMDTEARNES